ncbi:hypothetical protein CC80DRAFT_367769, partial [Byssothecium circinans]
MPFALEHDISEEILDNIISECTTGVLASLCRCSKKLNRIAIPHLYTAVSFNDRARANYILPFAYLIFTSPIHASYVRSFTLRQEGEDNAFSAEIEEEVGPKPAEKQPWPKFGGEDLEKALRRACAKSADDENEVGELYEKIRTGENENYVLALLFANFPNLQKLDFCIGYSFGEYTMVPFERVMRHGRERNAIGGIANNKPTQLNTTPFSVPLDVLITGADYDYPGDPLALAAFLNLPNLRRLYGWKIGDKEEPDEERDDQFSRLTPRSCPVEYIECRSSKLHEDNFALLINATVPGRLKTFLYEIGCIQATIFIDHEKIMESLQPHYETLECLGLTHEVHFPYPYDDETGDPAPLSFRCFKMLKQLKLAPTSIWGGDGFGIMQNLWHPATKEFLWKALPETLQELWITRANGQGEYKKATTKFVPDCLIPALYLLVQNRASYPLLDQLRIDFPISKWEADWLDQLDTFTQFAENNGIHCTVIVPSLTTRPAEMVERRWGWDEDVEWAPCSDNR